MTPLKPTEYKYLISPFWSDGGEMIKSTLQELCLRGVLGLEERWIYIDSRETHKRKRLYLVKGKNFTSYQTDSTAEQFLLTSFNRYEELSFAQVRNFITFHFKQDTDKFKDLYVYPDLKSRGLCSGTFFPTPFGRKEKLILKLRLANINTNIDALIQSHNALKSELDGIGLNIILLNKDVIDKLQEIDTKITDLELLKFFGDNSSFDGLTSFSALGSFGSIGSFDFADASVGFDGFGGGDFGGGGASGDW